jgi:hypothetical protein
MDLPIDDQELNIIVKALHYRTKLQFIGGDTALYEKLKLVKEVRDANPGGPYKKILREQHGMVA